MDKDHKIMNSPKKPSDLYHSRFQQWDRESWVRAGQRQDTPFDPKLDFFSESLSALFSHLDVKSISAPIRRDLLVLWLYNYLEFTVWLETGPVNEVCEMLR